MVKKFLCSIVCLIFAFNCLIGSCVVSAIAPPKPEAVSLSYDGMRGLIDKIAEKLSADTVTAKDRYDMYFAAVAFFEVDEDIDALIRFVNDPSTPVPVGFEPVAALISDFDSYKNEMIFTLCFIKSIEANKRIAALESFTNKTEYPDMTNAQADALASVYSEFVSKEFRDILLTDHQITDKVILSLLSCVKNYFEFTDDKDNTKKLAVDDVNNAFASRLSQNISPYFSEINDGSTADGDNIMEEIINCVNDGEDDNDLIADFKTVFSALDMYTPYEAPSGGGGGGGGRRLPISGEPNPIYKPMDIPVPPQPEPDEIQNIYDDTKTHWALPYLSVMNKREIFKGYEDGEFKPDRGITREEMAVVLVRVLGLEARLESIADASFTDSDKIGDWSKKAVALMVEMQIFKGYDDGSFRPQNTISREELAAVLARALTKSANNSEYNFTDKSQIGSWSAELIRKAYALGIIKGYGDNSFRPGNDVTRAEAAVMIYNFMVTENLL